ncbi:hypothetical protein QTP88_017254 [Uroleucon formosanum]
MIFYTAHTPNPLCNQNNNLYTPAASTRGVHLYLDVDIMYIMYLLSIDNCTVEAFPSVQQQFTGPLCPYNPCSLPPEYKSSRITYIGSPSNGMVLKIDEQIRNTGTLATHAAAAVSRFAQYSSNERLKGKPCEHIFRDIWLVKNERKKYEKNHELKTTKYTKNALVSRSTQFARIKTHNILLLYSAHTPLPLRRKPSLLWSDDFFSLRYCYSAKYLPSEISCSKNVAPLVRKKVELKNQRVQCVAAQQTAITRNRVKLLS